MRTKTVQIYAGVFASLLQLKYPATQKDSLIEMFWYKQGFSKLCFRKKYNFFHIEKVKVKALIVVV